MRHEFNECKSSLKCCTKDGGRPSAIGMQMQVANCPKGAVFKRYGTEHLGKRAHKRVQVSIEKLNESKPLDEVSKRLLVDKSIHLQQWMR